MLRINVLCIFVQAENTCVKREYLQQNDKIQKQNPWKGFSNIDGTILESMVALRKQVADGDGKMVGEQRSEGNSDREPINANSWNKENMVIVRHFRDNEIKILINVNMGHKHMK